MVEIGHNGGPPLEEKAGALTAKGKLQRIEAIIERDDLTAAQVGLTAADVRQVYGHLVAASQHHLAAFQR